MNVTVTKHSPGKSAVNRLGEPAIRIRFPTLNPWLNDTHESRILTHGGAMRTNIDIDDDLMREAMQASGDTTKRAVVERGLRLLIDTR